MSETDARVIGKIDDSALAIKYFIFIYNCFGLPTGNNMKAFCREFLYKIKDKSKLDLPKRKDANELWINIRKDLADRGGDINYEKNGGYHFYSCINKNMKYINDELKQCNTEEEQLNKLEETLKKLEFKRKINCDNPDFDKYKAILEYWWLEDKDMKYKDGDRLLSIPTGNPGENLWYVYDESRNELKMIRNSEHAPIPAGKTWNEWDRIIQNQQNKIEDYLNNENIDLLEVDTGEKEFSNDIEVLVNYSIEERHKAPNVEETKLTETPLNKKPDNTKDKSDNNAKNILVGSYMPAVKSKENIGSNTKEDIRNEIRGKIKDIYSSDKSNDVNNSNTEDKPKKQTIYKIDLAGNSDSKFNIHLMPSLIKKDDLGEYIRLFVKGNEQDTTDIRIYKNGISLIKAGAKIDKIKPYNDAVMIKAREKRRGLNIPLDAESILKNDIASNSIRLVCAFVYGNYMDNQLVDELGNNLALYRENMSKTVLDNCNKFKLDKDYIVSYIEDKITNVTSDELNIKFKLNLDTGRIDLIDKGKYIMLHDSYSRIDHLICYLIRYNRNSIYVQKSPKTDEEMIEMLSKFSCINDFNEKTNLDEFYKY